MSETLVENVLNAQPEMNRELEDLLLTLGAVQECCIVTRNSDEGAGRIAYFVRRGTESAEEIGREFRDKFPQAMTPDVFVPLAFLPLTHTGEVDRDALLAIEAWDIDLRAEVEHKIAREGGVARAAIVVEESGEGAIPLHLSDLIPGWKRTEKAGSNEAVSARPIATADTATRGQKPLSLSEGEPLHVAVPDTLQDALRRAASEFGTQGIVYVQEDESEIFQSYADLLVDAERILTSLRKLGAQPGERLIFQFQHNQDFVPAFWACTLGGFVPVPISVAPTYEQPNATISKLHNAWLTLERPWFLTGKDLFASVSGLSGRFHFDEDLRVAVIEDLRRAERTSDWHASSPDDLALLLFTSGSTGKPKAVRQCHRSLMRRSAATAQNNGFNSGNVSLNWMPLDHVGGIVMYHLLDVYLGARQIHAPTQAVAQAPLKWLDLVERHRATSTWAPNFAYALVNAQAEEIGKRHWDLSSLGFILNAGEAIVSRTARRFLELLEQHGLPATAMRPAWGMSETCSAVTFSSRFTLATTSDRDSFVEVGSPIPEFSMRIVDHEGELVEEGTIGRLQVKGPSITSGYFNNPTANEEAFTADGWFQTGDLGIMNDGSLTITGRQKDVIIVNGINFYSHELEAIVEETEGVEISFTAVCALREPGADTDSIAVFFTPSASGKTRLAGVIQDVRGNLVRNAGINPVWFVPLEKAQIPKTEIGKIQRAQLRQRLEAGEFEPVLKRVDVLTESAHTLPGWFFEKVWQRKNAMVPAGRVAHGLTVVFGDESEAGSEVCRLLRQRGQQAIEVKPGEIFEPGRASIERILYLRRGSGQLEAIQQILLLAKAVVVAAQVPVGLWVVSTHSQAVLADDVKGYENAALPAILRSLTAEEPLLECRHIDLPDNAGMSAVEVAGILIDEMDAAGSELEVAWRVGARYVPRLIKCSFDRTAVAASGFVSGGFYLITGGMGGIGTQIANRLLTQFQARLLITGRTHLSRMEAGAASGFDLLSALGPVRYAALDVCDLAALRAEVEAAEEVWGRKLDGVLHLAASYHDGPLINETAATLEDAFRAKAEGALTLDRLLDSRPEAIFIGFSSVLAFFPGAMVGPYAAANRILENVVASRHARGFRACSFAWSVWRETGMSRGQSSFEALRARGIQEMSADQAWKSLLAGLELRRPSLLIGLDAANAEIRRVSVGTHCGLYRFLAFYTSASDVDTERLNQLRFYDRYGTGITLRFHETGEIPVNGAGEVDRDALMAAYLRSLRGGVPYVEPETEAEREICAVWESVLSVPRIGVDDNFFALGGQSLLATRVMSRLRSTLGVDLALRSLFDTPTVRGLAVAVAKMLEERGGDNLAIRPVADRSRLPLSFTQQRLWYLDQLLPGSPVYNIPLVFRLDGALDIRALSESLDAVVQRHESLRTVFRVEDGEPVQKISDEARVIVRTADLRGFQGDAYAEALRLSAEAVRQPFDLSRDVLLRASVFQFADEAFVVALGMHHIAADGWSIEILMRELNAFYAKARSGSRPDFAPLPIQFADYSAWQRDYLQGDVLREHDEYWRQRLEGAPAQLKLPTDLPRLARQTFRGAIHTFTISPDLGSSLAEVCRAAEVTPFIALLAVFQILLRQYSGQDDISVGSPIANRTNLETEGLIGFFSNTMVLRTVFAPDASYKAVLGQVREMALGAYSHQHMPFERLVAILKRPRNPGYNPLFQANFRVVTAAPEPLTADGIAGIRVPVDPKTARFDLALDLLFTPERFEGYFEYSTDLFLPATILRIQSDFEVLLRVLCKRPDAPLSSLGLEKLVTAGSGRQQGTIRRRAAR